MSLGENIVILKKKFFFKLKESLSEKWNNLQSHTGSKSLPTGHYVGYVYGWRGGVRKRPQLESLYRGLTLGNSELSP